MRIVHTLVFTLTLITLQAQDTMNEELPYAQIPEAPEEYTPGTVVARMIDGLGFRYYWATEALTEDNLDYTPGNEGRTIRQTLEHVYGLSEIILNSAQKRATERNGAGAPLEMSYGERRQATLQNFRDASLLFAEAKDLNEHAIVFKRPNGQSEFPFWNNINGPIEDAIWHAGQIVLLRRSSGNPINPKVNVFLGKLND